MALKSVGLAGFASSGPVLITLLVCKVIRIGIGTGTGQSTRLKNRSTKKYIKYAKINKNIYIHVH